MSDGETISEARLEVVNFRELDFTDECQIVRAGALLGSPAVNVYGHKVVMAELRALLARAPSEAHADRPAGGLTAAMWRDLYVKDHDELLRTHEALARANQRWADFEEREAACCPEDVGFDEYIKSLTNARQLWHDKYEALNAARQPLSNERVRRAREALDDLRGFRELLQKTIKRSNSLDESVDAGLAAERAIPMRQRELTEAYARYWPVIEDALRHVSEPAPAPTRRPAQPATDDEIMDAWREVPTWQGDRPDYFIEGVRWAEQFHAIAPTPDRESAGEDGEK